MFRFTTGERAPLYSAILYAFGEANERLVTALSLDDVRERLRGAGWFDALTDDDLVDALWGLKGLAGWASRPRRAQSVASVSRPAARSTRTILTYWSGPVRERARTST
ncbi:MULTISPECIES: DUF2397 family protein [unclassified Streptomyces]|uniref:DUF2397 family protein n=1 Tax=unclassified Streptomyces TaxID=2593676 RepID=UPI0030E04D95